MASTTKFTELDFNQIKTNLKEYLRGQDRFKDYDFEGSNMSVLLDILAYNTYQNNFYTNMAISEMFMDSAQLRDSVVSHAKGLGYLPRSRKSARALVNVRVAAPSTAVSVTIPRKTRFTAVCGNQVYTFYSDATVSVEPVNGVFTYTALPIYEGRYVTELFDVTEDNQSFELSNATVDIDSIKVYVRDTDEASSTRTEYLRKQNLFGVATSDQVFYVEASFDDKYKIEFGRDLFGAQPVVGNVVEIEYRTCLADEPNGANNFSPATTINGYTATVISNTVAEGGAERETKESIQFFAPKALQIQERAITEADYRILLKNRFSEINAVSVYGGEELDPPRYGRVAVAVDIAGTDGISTTLQSKYSDFLKDVSPLSIEPIFVSPQYMYVQLNTKVYYNLNKSALTTTEIRTKALDAIANYSINSLSDFGKTYRHSKLTAAIDDADANIVSNETTARLVLTDQPVLNTTRSYELKFNNPISAVTSSAFVTSNGNTAVLKDNGSGVMQIVRSGTGDTVVYNSNIGTVDYTTGLVMLNNFGVQSYTGSELQILATPTNLDVYSPKDRVVRIRSTDVTISVQGVRV
jgi:hypothetical protein